MIISGWNFKEIFWAYQSNFKNEVYCNLDFRFINFNIFLRHWTTSRKVAGSISNGVIGIGAWLNPSVCIMALGSTQPLKKWVPWISLGGKGGRCSGLTTFPPSRAYCLEIMGISTCFSPKGRSRSVMGFIYLCIFTIGGTKYNSLFFKFRLSYFQANK